VASYCDRYLSSHHLYTALPTAAHTTVTVRMSEEAVMQFMSITNTDADTARQYLAMCSDVDQAVCCFFAQDAPPPAPPAPTIPTRPVTNDALLSTEEHISDERAMQEALALSMAEAGQQPVSDEELIRQGLLSSSVPGNSFAPLDVDEVEGDDMDEETRQAMKQALEMSMDTQPAPGVVQQAASSVLGQSGDDTIVNQFKEMCGVEDTNMAQNYLDAFGGDLNAAVGSYMEGHQAPAAAQIAEAEGAQVEGIGFATMYTEQYGLLHPKFWNEDYEAAVRAARCEGKMMLVYFHDQHEGTHFCRITLSREHVCEIIDKHFIMFACMNTEGRALAARLKQTGENVNPYLILVNPVNPNSAVKVLQGMFSPDELVAELDQVWAKHGKDLEAQAAQFVSRESDRVAREMDRQEKDSEFEIALAADRARDLAETARQTQELAAQAELANQQEAAEAEKQLLAERKIALVKLRRENAQNLGPEPEQGVKPASKVRSGPYPLQRVGLTNQALAGTEMIVQIKCSLPDGSSVVRRFHGSDSIQMVYDWVWAHDCLAELDDVQMELWSSFPRKKLDPASSISESELCPQAMIVVQLPAETSPVNSP